MGLSTKMFTNQGKDLTVIVDISQYQQKPKTRRAAMMHHAYIMNNGRLGSRF